MGKSAYEGIFLAPESIVVYPGLSVTDLTRCAGSDSALNAGEVHAEGDALANRYFED
jgi:hypothetical protein